MLTCLEISAALLPLSIQKNATDFPQIVNSFSKEMDFLSLFYYSAKGVMPFACFAGHLLSTAPLFFAILYTAFLPLLVRNILREIELSVGELNLNAVSSRLYMYSEKKRWRIGGRGN